MCIALFHALVLALALVVPSQGMRRARRPKGSSANSTKVDCFSMYDGMVLLQLSPCSIADVAELTAQMETLSCEPLHEEVGLPAKGGCGDAEVVCSKEAAASLERFGSVRLISSDVGAQWRDASGRAEPFVEGVGAATDFYSSWRDLSAQEARVQSIVQASGGIAKIETAGKSLQGRDMKIVRFTGSGYRSGDPKLFMTFNLHAREWLTGMSGVYAIEHLVEKVREDPSYLAGMEVVMMPMANPDGFVHTTQSDRMHRKNMNGQGVDLNRNFNAGWGACRGSSANAGSQTYQGPSPMSEPETQVIAQVMGESPLTVYIDIHSFGELILWAYGYTTKPHPRGREYKSLALGIQSAIRSAHGQTWTEGPTDLTLYTASGITQDYADALGAFGITFELRGAGGGFAPPASEILPGAEECFAGILASIDYAKRPTAPSPMPYPFQGPHCLACVGEDGNYSQWCQGLGDNFVCTGSCKEYEGELPTPAPRPTPAPQPTPTPRPTPPPPRPTPGPTPSPQPLPSPQPSPAPTPTPAPLPTPSPPAGGCEHEKDCDVSPWCRDVGFEAWCRNQGQGGSCPAPYCRQAGR